MTRPRLEDKYVTLRWLKLISRGMRWFYGRYRLAIGGALVFDLVPTITLAYYMLTTGFPKSWGPLGGLTTFPGHFVLEKLFGLEVWLAVTEATYAQHVKGWLLMLVVNFFGWLVPFVLITAAARWMYDRGRGE